MCLAQDFWEHWGPHSGLQCMWSVSIEHYTSPKGCLCSSLKNTVMITYHPSDDGSLESSREDCQNKTRSLVKDCGSQNNSPCRCPHPNSQNLYVRLHGKGEPELQMKLKWLISWPCDGEIVLDYSDGPNAITIVPKRRRGRQKEEPESGSEMDSVQDYQLWWWRRGHKTQNAGNL